MARVNFGSTCAESLSLVLLYTNFQQTSSSYEVSKWSQPQGIGEVGVDAGLVEVLYLPQSINGLQAFYLQQSILQLLFVGGAQRAQSVVYGSCVCMRA